jgi:ABC-type multidrug transport system ATPase subunit/ABC-type Na+ efflux pump permease subunit
MSAAGDDTPVLVGRTIRKTFRRDGEVVRALDDVAFEVAHGTLAALVGPDGAGKTTLLRCCAGLIPLNGGELKVLGVNVSRDPQQIQERIGYMPQRFGLYEDLTVQENLDLYADMHGVSSEERQHRYPRLLAMTALGPFVDRLAGRLSGGMKQKLGLACTLIRSPELLLLDEPTVGVDPLSRRELWEIVQQLVHDERMTVLLSTSYLDEAEKCGHVVVLHEGKVLSQGNPSEVSRLAEGRTFLAEPPPGQTARILQAQLLDDSGVVDAVPDGGRVRFIRKREDHQKTGQDEKPAFSFLPEDRITPAAAHFEDGFMVLLKSQTATEEHGAGFLTLERPPLEHQGDAAAVEVRDLVRRFGQFTAVDHVSFEVRRGEVYGLLGPNGAGKTTTFRILCGLLPATEGTLQVAGVDLRRARASARQRIGYVAQKFSLYGQLSVRENLEFFGSAYGLRGATRTGRIEWALNQFALTPHARLPSGQLPGGFKQRLAMAGALLHQPDILFLDEPTSGADPIARREFWRRITSLANQGVTAIVTTHFLQEAEYCDRIAILDSGRILAQGTPAEVRRRGRGQAGREPTMEEAFIAIVEEARRKDQNLEDRKHDQGAASREPRTSPEPRPREFNAIRRDSLSEKTKRVLSLVRKEARQIVRDPSSIAMGIVLPVILILLFGYGLSLDVQNVPIAVVFEDPSPEATELAAGFQLSPYFDAQFFTSMPEAEKLMLEHKVDGIVRIRPDFARHLALGDAEVQLLVHGTDANRARIIQGYAQGAIGLWSARRSAEGRDAAGGPVLVHDRLWFNTANDSHYFLVPGLVVLVMTLIGAMLTSLVMAREWERGTLEALFVTPVRVGEILLGKTIPYFVLGMIGLALCLFAAKYLFHVPVRGSLWVLAGGSMLYLLVALSIGLLISSVTKSQFVASQLTLLVTFLPAFMLSGFLFDLRSMPAIVRTITYVLPARYFVALLQTAFLAGDVWEVILPNGAVLAGMAGVLLLASRLVTRKRLE